MHYSSVLCLYARLPAIVNFTGRRGGGRAAGASHRENPLSRFFESGFSLCLWLSPKESQSASPPNQPLFIHSYYICSHTSEALFDFLIASVDVRDIAYLGYTLSRKSCHNKSSAAP